MKKAGIQKTGIHKKHKQIKFFCMLLITVMLLEGCSLAIPDAGPQSGSSRLIGAFITMEYLDLSDTDTSLKDMQKQQKLYADIDKNGSKRPSDWEISFPDTDGICFFAPLWTDENGENMRGGIYDSRVGEKSIHFGTSGTEETLDLNGTIYVTPKADGKAGYYLNPVYQETGGRIYVVSGTGCTMQADCEIAEGEQSALTSVVSITDEDGRKLTEKANVTLQLSVMYRPVQITVCQMDQKHRLLEKKSYRPEEVPETLSARKETAYLLTEIQKESPAGKKVVSRDVFEKKEGTECEIESYCAVQDGVILKKRTRVDWEEYT